MYHLPDFLYEINLLSVSLRLILALLFGGIIGLERGSNRHPAGFRTHILVCVGAALAMMTNQFILQQFDTGDPLVWALRSSPESVFLVLVRY